MDTVCTNDWWIGCADSSVGSLKSQIKTFLSPNSCCNYLGRGGGEEEEEPVDEGRGDEGRGDEGLGDKGKRGSKERGDEAIQDRTRRRMTATGGIEKQE